jgi:phospholipid/cholesterol/gamma-HCH transport system substrate-binding protein
MNKSRLELKVGLFVFIGLVLLALLLIQFSKGLNFFKSTYQLRLTAGDVGGLKPRSGVLMSGVQVGSVSRIELAPDGRSVTIFLSIYSSYPIYTNAAFAIEAAGFLGDQYVAIKPAQSPGPRLKDNDEVFCAEPLNIQEVARSAAGFISRVDEAARKLDDTINDVRRMLLNERNLTNLAGTVDTLRIASERALAAMEEVNSLLTNNAPMVSYSMSNIVLFSEKLDSFAGSMNEILATNRESIAAIVQNAETSSALLKSVMEDTHAGKGLAGTLLHDQQIAAKAGEIVNNLSITSSNLNRLGLWRVLFPKKSADAPAAPSGTSPAVSSPKAGSR